MKIKFIYVVVILFMSILFTNCVLEDTSSYRNADVIEDDIRFKTTEDIEKLLVKKWVSHRFDLLDDFQLYSDFSKEKIKQTISKKFVGNYILLFNADKTGKFTIKKGSMDFTWKVEKGENVRLFLDLGSTDFNRDYIINSINKSELSLTYENMAAWSVDSKSVDVRANYIYK